MRRSIITSLLMFVALAACAQLKIYRLQVGDFNEFTVAHNINVVYKHMPDSAGYAVYVCNPEMAHALTFSNTKNRLKLEFITEKQLSDPVPTVTLYSSELKKVTNQGDSLVTIAALNPSTQFSARVIGNGEIRVDNLHSTKVDLAVEAGHGRITASGRAGEAKYTSAGTGAIQAGDIEATNVTCWMMIGNGNIDCRAAEKLSVYGAAGGKIIYKGNPKIKKRCVGVKLIPY